MDEWLQQHVDHGINCERNDNLTNEYYDGWISKREFDSSYDRLSTEYYEKQAILFDSMYSRLTSLDKENDSR
ncbi:MAG: hypothetical protein FWE45_05170 [Firmicutes bacterium]|nr:hypothetical protein [Bacillota bacterium]